MIDIRLSQVEKAFAVQESIAGVLKSTPFQTFPERGFDDIRTRDDVLLWLNTSLPTVLFSDASPEQSFLLFGQQAPEGYPSRRALKSSQSEQKRI